MTVKNTDRVIVQALREIADERGIEMAAFSDDWIIRLKKASITRYVFGYNFDLNPASAYLLTNDKSATSAVLEEAGIPHVEHRLFLHPDVAEHECAEGGWADMTVFAREHDYGLVCKPNNGSGGRDVRCVSSEPGLQRAVQELFERHRSICLSPFCRVGREYRLVMVEEECVLAYTKRRPTVRGDGKSTLLELLANEAKAVALPGPAALALLSDNRDDPFEVLGEGQTRALSWRHNLGLFSRPEPVGSEGTLRDLKAVAVACVRLFNLRFSSVDIVATEGRLLVLEVNSGVMMETYARVCPDGFRRAKEVYARAVDRMFAGV